LSVNFRTLYLLIPSVQARIVPGFRSCTSFFGQFDHGHFAFQFYLLLLPQSREAIGQEGARCLFSQADPFVGTAFADPAPSSPAEFVVDLSSHCKWKGQALIAQKPFFHESVYLGSLIREQLVYVVHRRAGPQGLTELTEPFSAYRSRNKASKRTLTSGPTFNTTAHCEGKRVPLPLTWSEFGLGSLACG
jgi:hypothetical protein